MAKKFRITFECRKLLGCQSLSLERPRNLDFGLKAADATPGVYCERQPSLGTSNSTALRMGLRSKRLFERFELFSVLAGVLLELRDIGQLPLHGRQTINASDREQAPIRLALFHAQ